MPRAPLAVLPALLMLVALALGGCGGDNLSAGDLRAQASAICARSAAATDRVALPTSEDQGDRFLRDGLARMRPALAQLQLLKPPGELRDSYAQALQLRRRQIALIARDRRAIARGEDAIVTFRALQAEIAPLTDLEGATWQALQIPACAPR